MTRKQKTIQRITTAAGSIWSIIRSDALLLALQQDRNVIALSIKTKNNNNNALQSNGLENVHKWLSLKRCYRSTAIHSLDSFIYYVTHSFFQLYRQLRQC